ncbi:MAG: DUF5719 family protein [Actinomycetota bacterium]
MRRYIIVFLGVLLCLTLGTPLLAVSSPPAEEVGFEADAVSGSSPNYRTFTEMDLKSIKQYKQTLNGDGDIVSISEKLAGGHYTCSKNSDPFTYFEQDWKGVDLSYLLEQEVGLKDGTTGIKVIAEDGYAVTLTLDEMRGNGNPRGLPTLLGYMYGEPSENNPNAPDATGAPWIDPLPASNELTHEDGGPFRLILPQQVEGPDPRNESYDSPAGTGTPNWNKAVMWVRALEVQPVPPGIPALDYEAIPPGEIVVYGNIRNRKTVTVDQLKSIKPVAATYAWEDSSGGTGETVCTGIPVDYLLDEVIGLQDSATDVMFFAADGWGFKDTWTLDEIRGAYGDDGLKFMLGWNKDGTDLGPEPDDDGPLQLIKPAYEANPYTLSRWLKWVREVHVLPLGDDPGVDETVVPTDRIIVCGDIDAGNVPNEWFFAEGYTGAGFETYISIANPNSWQTRVIVDYFIEGETPQQEILDVPARSRTTVNPVNTIGTGKAFSTRVEGYHGDSIVVERAMYWNGMGGGHCASGVNAPSNTWYLAEGCTSGTFETYLLLENPGDVAANVDVTYMKGDGDLPGTPVEVPARSRKTINLAADGAGGLVEVSTMLESDQPIIAERAIYWDNKRGGTCEFGVNAPSDTWYLAEGATSSPYTTYILVQNPNPTDVTVDLSFMTSTGLQEPPEWQDIPIAGGTRRSFNLVEHVSDFNVSTRVASEGGGVIAERAMYWNGMASGHVAHGQLSPKFRSYLAEGCTTGGFETWVLLQNPGPSDAVVYITYQTENGAIERAPLPVPAGVRTNVNVGLDVGETTDVSTLVRSSAPIVAERAVYWKGQIEGTCSTGYSAW